jgi:hypothetical protein
MGVVMSFDDWIRDQASLDSYFHEVGRPIEWRVY